MIEKVNIEFISNSDRSYLWDELYLYIPPIGSVVVSPGGMFDVQKRYCVVGHICINGGYLQIIID